MTGLKFFTQSLISAVFLGLFAAKTAWGATKTVAQIINTVVSSVINPLIYLMFAVALLFFVWGVVDMIRQADNESARSKGKLHIIWGLIGLAIMFSVFGLVNIIKDVVCGGTCPTS